jgi:hypothetical protein
VNAEVKEAVESRLAELKPLRDAANADQEEKQKAWTEAWVAFQAIDVEFQQLHRFVRMCEEEDKRLKPKTEPA